MKFSLARDDGKNFTRMALHAKNNLIMLTKQVRETRGKSNDEQSSARMAQELS